MQDFKDPVNKEEILEKLQTIKTREETHQFIDNHFPGWLVISLTEYSKDYNYLQKNWEKICEMSKCKTQEIVLVSDIKFDKEHIAINVIAEFMTRNGYCVRRSEEFLSCVTCEKAIPCQNLWKLMKDKNMPVPKKWSEKCSSC
jgi:hypothetical protein